MTDLPKQGFSLPPAQQAIRDKCFHPTGTFVEFPIEDVETSIPERFEKIVELYPDRFAVKTTEHQLTYEKLNKLANQLAHAILARQGSKPEPVALFLDRWDTLVVGHLAVLKAGKFSLVLNPAAEVNRTDHLLRDSGARIMIVDQYTAGSARSSFPDECSMINLDELGADLSKDNPTLPSSGDAYAYIRYTSGSTGSAKGAIKTHRHLLKNVKDFSNGFHLGPEDRVMILGFGSIGKHLFNALLTGACFCPYDARRDGLVQLANWITREHITVYFSFPTALRYFFNGLSNLEVFPALRLIELEGETVYRTDVELVKKHVSSDCFVVNTLSSAETGTVSLYFLDMETAVDSDRVPVGYPVEGVEILILDHSGQPLDFDQVGEVAVRSALLSGGYWRKPEVTSRKFIAQDDNGLSLLYRTGDLGRLSQGGCLHLLGRKDFQVKIRSFRVDVTEVEAVLAQHGEVQSSAVIGKNDQTGNTRLVAYVVPRTSPGPTFAALKSFLRDKLPEYMVPSELIFLDDLPLMSTGKINRGALLDLSGRRPGSNEPVAVPRTVTEKQLSAIWTKVLSLPKVGIDDDFFDLGGHSLAASQVISRVIQTFKLELPVKALFDAPTVRQMAAVVEQHRECTASEAELGRMLREVEAMTDEEVQRHLAGRPVKS